MMQRNGRCFTIPDRWKQNHYSWLEYKSLMIYGEKAPTSTITVLEADPMIKAQLWNGLYDKDTKNASRQL